MRKIATIKENDRKALFQNTAPKMGLTNAIIEKDFWVCFMLDYLFHRCEWKDNIAFKGGTSLSKAYGLIERFSEDIDLILDWRVIGFEIDEPWKERSVYFSHSFFIIPTCKEWGSRGRRFDSCHSVPEIWDFRERMSYIKVMRPFHHKNSCTTF